MHRHCLLLAAAAAALSTLALRPALASPLDLGPGGVFDDADSNAYWARRFGSGFLASLAARQRDGLLGNAGTPSASEQRQEKAVAKLKVEKEPKKKTKGAKADLEKEVDLLVLKTDDADDKEIVPAAVGAAAAAPADVATPAGDDRESAAQHVDDSEEAAVDYYSYLDGPNGGLGKYYVVHNGVLYPRNEFALDDYVVYFDDEAVDNNLL